MKTMMKMTMAGLALGVCGVTAADEFVGPFPSWANVRTEFGAVGDGKADDTEALQNGLNAARKKVLYLPAGTYRIIRTLTVSISRLYGYYEIRIYFLSEVSPKQLTWRKLQA